MKRKITPTPRERMMREDEFIVSKTDTKGRITYGNRTFIEFSGYTEAELLGSQQNIIRHPDMPRGVFRLLWDLIQKGEEFFGYVKNLSQDGSFYWVFANITPCYSPNGELVGYYSVRRTPRPHALDIIQPLYRDMLAAEQQAGAHAAIEAGSRILQNQLDQHGTDYAHFVITI